MGCPEIIPAILEAARRLEQLGIAYVHLSEADWDDAPQVPESFRHELRAVFSGAIIVAGGYDAARAEAIIDSRLADLVAFGRPFIANPDFPARIAMSQPLAAFDANTLFGGDARGYSDYPTISPSITPGVPA
jgi:N-ethylmaleimide reductase